MDLLYTFIFCIILTFLKYIAIVFYAPGNQLFELMGDFSDGETPFTTASVLMMLGYIVSCPVQEAIARGLL
jgi:hypothetical protein